MGATNSLLNEVTRIVNAIARSEDHGDWPIKFENIANLQQYVQIWEWAMEQQAQVSVSLGSARSLSIVPQETEHLPFDPGDATRRGKVRNPLLNSTAVQLWRIDNGFFGIPKIRPDASERDSFIAEHPELQEAAEFAARNRWAKIYDPTVAASAHWFISRVHGPEMTEHYLAQVLRGSGPDRACPINGVRRYAESQSKNMGDRLVAHDHLLAVTLKAFNLYAMGERKDRLHPPKGLPEITPVIRLA